MPKQAGVLRKSVAPFNSRFGDTRSSMQITFGKHKGKSIEEVLLKHPDYIHWMLQQDNSYGAMKALQEETIRLIDVFDSKPFVEPCHGRNCTRIATRCTVYRDAVDNPYWWCDNCDPGQSGASEYKITSLSA